MNKESDEINKLIWPEAKIKSGSKKHFWGIIALLVTLIGVAVLISFKSFPQIENSNVVKAAKKTGQSVKATVFYPFSFSVSQPKTILFLGIPGPGNDAPDLTDTIAVARINFDPPKISLISIPRDLWVSAPGSDYWTKINSLYAIGKNEKGAAYGPELIKTKTEEIIGQKIDNHVLIDLSVLKYIIDSQDGINIMVKEDIYDPEFPGPNHSYQTFEIKSGWRYMDGETALKYVRTRHSPGGDFDRIQRQQQVLEALKQKLLAMDLIGDLPKVLGILKELHNRVKTDISWLEIPDYWQTFKGFSPEDIKNIVIEKENRLIISGGIVLDGQLISALSPRAGAEDYSEIQKYINANLQ